jgi:RHS repeat-associated protein
VETNGTWAAPTYYPYGEPETAGGLDGKPQFGTYVRDSTASAQDYAGQRYYSYMTANFLSPDPGGMKAADPKNPQSWNRYAYVQGDPVNHLDRTGLIEATAEDCIDDPDGCEEEDWGDCGSMFAFMEVASCSEGDDDTGGGGEAAPTPCSFGAQDLLDYMENTPAYVDKGTKPSSKPLATLAFAQDMMADAVADNVDPRLLVAISFVESKWGGEAPALRTQNGFGLMPGGTLKNFSNSGGWAAGIAAAADTAANHIGAGQNTISALYSGNTSKQNGGLAAYCVGAGCADKTKYLTTKFTAMGGNVASLTSPCCLGNDGNYYEK